MFETFDTEAEPVVLAEVGRYVASTGPNYTVAGNLITFRRINDRDRRLVWYARDGTRLGELPGEGDWANPSLSLMTHGWQRSETNACAVHIAGELAIGRCQGRAAGGFGWWQIRRPGLDASPAREADRLSQSGS